MGPTGSTDSADGAHHQAILADSLTSPQPGQTGTSPAISNSFLAENEQTHPTRLSNESWEDSPELKAWLQSSVRRLSEAGYIIQGSGVTFENLSVSGTGVTVGTQSTIGSILMAPFRLIFYGSKITRSDKKQKLSILSDFSGFLREGELLAVLGRPGNR
jgi:hypothetical protein